MQFKCGGSWNLLDCEGEHSWKQFLNNPTWQTCNPIPSIQQTIILKSIYGLIHELEFFLFFFFSGVCVCVLNLHHLVKIVLDLFFKV